MGEMHRMGFVQSHITSVPDICRIDQQVHHLCNKRESFLEVYET
jgi:hypothetical protein